MKYTEIKAKKGRMTQVFRDDGTVIPVTEVCSIADVTLLKEGADLSVRGTSKGHGFTGAMKRWNFKGGPATHGSTRHRGTGSIGAGTTPGRVYMGKKMPGHMGNVRVTVRGLTVVEVNIKDQKALIKGAIPGFPGAAVVLLLPRDEKEV